MVSESLYKLLLFHSVYLFKDLFAKLGNFLLVVFNTALYPIDSYTLCNAEKLIVGHRVDCALCHRPCAVVGIGIKIEQALCYVGNLGEINAFNNACYLLD